MKMIRTTILLFALAGLIACGDGPAPAPAPQIVKQKISTHKVVPAPAAAQPEAQSGSKKAESKGTEIKEAEAKVTEAKGAEAKGAEAKGAEAKAAEAKGTSAQQAEGKSTSDLIQESLQIAGSYNPKGRFDPFEPLFKEEPQAIEEVGKKGQRHKRVPQTPLERIALSQLKLSAIIRAASGNCGLVEDATGKGYVIEKGTYIGLNSGKVVRIEPDRVVIEEEVESILGNLVIQNTELKLQKPAGEL